ncbi:hypothetical protein EDD11_005187 [Mortierella claussenii]|nr:hypothetical protein EDD11_005187 [Mortierella claussenii]
MQRVLWTCARCEKFAGFTTNTPPPQKYQTQCMAWGVTITDWKAPYTGPVAPGTSTTPLTSAGGGGGTTQPVNPGTGGTTSSVTSPTGGNGNVTSSGSSSVSPTSTDGAGAGAGPSSGPSGTAIGISLGIIGVAAMSGAIAVFMMKRSRRRRHEPLDLDGTYVGLDDQWEKPGRVQSPPMIPSPIASGAPVASRGPMQPGHRPSPFGSRPGGGGSVVGGYEPQYDQQYDQYDNKYDHPYVAPHHPPGPPGGGYDAYNHGSGYQGYAAHDYGYEHTVPTSGPFHGGKGGEGGQYL